MFNFWFLKAEFCEFFGNFIKKFTEFIKKREFLVNFL